MHMWIDDARNPPENNGDPMQPFIVCRNSYAAMRFIDQVGIDGIDLWYLDHDLGGHDTVMRFLKDLQVSYPDNPINPQRVVFLTANPIGLQNMQSFINCWWVSVHGPQ